MGVRTVGWCEQSARIVILLLCIITDNKVILVYLMIRMPYLIDVQKLLLILFNAKNKENGGSLVL
jgi:hypothetical protein